MLALRLPRGVRTGLLGAACAVLVAPGPAWAGAPAQLAAARPAVRQPDGVGIRATAPLTGPRTRRPGRADLNGQINAAEQDLEIVVEQYDLIQTRLAGTQQQRAALVAALLPLQRRVADLQQGVDQFAADLYESGAARLSAVFSAGSPGGMLDQLSAAQHLAREEQEQVTLLRDAQAGLAGRQRELDALAAQQAGERAALAARRTAILARIASLRQLRTTAGTGWVRPQPLPPPVAPVPVSAPGSAGQAVAFALAQLGKAYVWGAAGPGTYDCSGLTMAAWRAAGVSLPHNAAQQWRSVAHVTRAELRPGDLIFYYGDIHHVALYLGGGRMVHAPTQGLNVMISPVGLAPIFGYGRPG